ncbi:MAG: hypothetical protein GY755_04085 [Chloroflexi bacterium]|nr:hypothetical protein [Chloroflexota bacterium]
MQEETKMKETPDTEKKLMSFFSFNKEDMLCNRAGKLSEKQKEMFRIDGLEPFIWLFFSGFLFIALLATDVPDNISLVSWGVYSLLYYFFVTLFSGLVYRLTMLPVRVGEVRTVLGEYKPLPNSRRARGFLIGDMIFSGKYEYRETLELGRSYRVYYTPRHKKYLLERILSIEILEPSAEDVLDQL